jgi:hypothetical protein
MRLATLVAALGVIASCGGSGSGDGGPLPGSGTFSCRAAFPGADGGAGQLAVCIDATGANAQQVESNRQQCTAQGNTPSSELCPRAGAAGGCRQTTPAAPGIVLTTWYYETGGATAAEIQTLCEGLASIAPAGLMITFVLP